jgi:hypothetical protein
VALLLTLLVNGAGPPFNRAFAAKVLADLGATVAVPTLRRLARHSAEAEVRAAAKGALERLSRESPARQLGGHRRAC